MDEEDGVLAVHTGRAANCSSLGSIVDVLFVSSVAGATLLAAIAVLKQKKPRETTQKKTEQKLEQKPERKADADPR